MQEDEGSMNVKSGASRPTRTTHWVLEDDAVSLAVDRDNGWIRGLMFKQAKVDPFAIVRQNMAGHLGYLRVFDERDGRWYSDLSDRLRITEANQRGQRITMIKRFAGAPFVLFVMLTLEDGLLTWQVRAEKATRKTQDRSLRVGFNLPLLAGWQVWAPCATGEFTFDGMDDFNFDHVQVSYVSPRDIILPMVSHYSKELDIGYSLLEPIGDRVPAARFQFDNAQKLFNWGCNEKPAQKLPTLEALNYYIGLVGDRPMETRVQVAFHGGDWRPALGKVYAAYREYFDPDSTAIYDHEGVFYGGNPYSAEESRPWAGMGCRINEVHAHFYYYGDYFQDGKQRWRRQSLLEGVFHKFRKMGQKKSAWEVVEFLDKHTDEELADLLYGPEWRQKGIDLEKAFYHTRERIKAGLKELVRRGLCPYWYFNYTDGFPPVVEKKWPDAICRDEEGRPIPSGWWMAHNMNANLRTSFGRFCEESAKKILAEYPELNGFFLDCFRHYEIDYAHNDGVTVVDHRPAYSVNFSYDDITCRIKELMKATGRSLAMFANKPQTIRSMRYVDGMLLEGDGDVLEEKYFWACIAKPNFFLWTSDRASLDENLRRAVLHGCFPRHDWIPGKTHEEMVAIYRRYLPLYEHFRRRVLCFEPDPVRVPKGCQVKLFTAGRDYVAGIVNLHVDSDWDVKYPKTQWALFRVARGWDVGKVGVRFPGDEAMREAPFKFNGTMLAVPLEGFKNCAVVRLFVTGESGKAIGNEKFTGPVDSCGDPESSFADVSGR